MSDTFLDTNKLPFCKGCSHHLVTRNTDKALKSLGLKPLDVILVTDIGCHGIIDRRFSTHTVHGLHGRSVALASGISAALSNPKKKIIVFIGDGGASIGMNHLIAAAHRNFDMTVVLLNNMLYGMTGGQQSDLTPGSFTVNAVMDGFTDGFLDMTKIVKNSGAAHVSRIVAKGDFSPQIAEAISVEGFSMIEILEICPSYGLKHNEGLSITNLVENLGIPLEYHNNKNAKKARLARRENPPSLFNLLRPVEKQFEHNLKMETSILIGGSAREGVQVATNVFAKAAMSCGLHVTVKGNYPVTVGTGYSASEIVLSPDPIKFSGIRNIDYAVIASEAGMAFLKNRFDNQASVNIIADSSVTVDLSGQSPIFADFRNAVKVKEVNLVMLMVLLKTFDIFPPDAMTAAISRNKIIGNIDMDKVADLSPKSPN